MARHPAARPLLARSAGDRADQAPEHRASPRPRDRRRLVHALPGDATARRRRPGHGHRAHRADRARRRLAPLRAGRGGPRRGARGRGHPPRHQALEPLPGVGLVARADEQQAHPLASERRGRRPPHLRLWPGQGARGDRLAHELWSLPRDAPLRLPGASDRRQARGRAERRVEPGDVALSRARGRPGVRSHRARRGPHLRAHEGQRPPATGRRSVDRSPPRPRRPRRAHQGSRRPLPERAGARTRALHHPGGRDEPHRALGDGHPRRDRAAPGARRGEGAAPGLVEGGHPRGRRDGGHGLAPRRDPRRSLQAAAPHRARRDGGDLRGRVRRTARSSR